LPSTISPAMVTTPIALPGVLGWFAASQVRRVVWA
jgi:hypothetical protein